MRSLNWKKVDDKREVLDNIRLGQSILVKGSPGTGKTYLGVRIAERIYDFLKPWQRILFLTFSKFAKVQIVNEKKKQLENSEIRHEAATRLNIFNFHSLWWEWISVYFAYLEITMHPRLILESQRCKELEEIIIEYKSLIPDDFKTIAGEIRKIRGKRSNQEFNKDDLLFMMYNSLNIMKFGINFLPDKLRQIASRDNFNNFLLKCSEQIKESNKKGLFWHDETAYYAAILLEGHPNFATWFREVYPVVIIDEFHDTDLAQWSVIRLMRSISLIGLFDPDQMIYSWRGASAKERIASFDKQFSPMCFQLVCEESNPRSGKRIFGDLRSGDVEFKTIPKNGNSTQQIYKAAIYLRFKLINILKDNSDTDIAVLCRTNEEANFFFERLKRKYESKKNNIYKIYKPFAMVRRLGSEHAPFSNIRGYLHHIVLNDDVNPIRNLLSFVFRFFLLDNNEPNFDFGRVRYRKAWKKDLVLLSQNLEEMRKTENLLSTLITLPVLIDEFVESYINMEIKRYLDSDTYSCLRFVSGRLSKVELDLEEKDQIIESVDKQIIAFENYYLNNPKLGISVMTAHQSKGREYQHVIIPWSAQYPFTARPGLFGWSSDDDDLQYVARTRAKETVTIFYPEDNPSDLIKPYL